MFHPFLAVTQYCFHFSRPLLLSSMVLLSACNGSSVGDGASVEADVDTRGRSETVILNAVSYRLSGQLVSNQLAELSLVVNSTAHAQMALTHNRWVLTHLSGSGSTLSETILETDSASLDWFPENGGQYRIHNELIFEDGSMLRAETSVLIDDAIRELNVPAHYDAGDRLHYIAYATTLTKASLLEQLEQQLPDAKYLSYDPLSRGHHWQVTAKPSTLTFDTLQSLGIFLYRLTDPKDGDLSLQVVPVEGTLTSSQDDWHVKHLGLFDIWDHTTQARRFAMGVVDGGFSNHEDLNGSGIRNFFGMLPSIDAYPSGVSHGNAVLGAIGAMGNNGKGISGMLWAVPFDVASFRDPKGTLSVYRLMLSYNQTKPSSEAPIKVISGSFGYTGSRNWSSAESARPIELLASRRHLMAASTDTLFVFAAGNDSVDARYSNGAMHYYRTELAKLPNLIVVSSLEQEGHLSYYSDYGAASDIAAPTDFLSAGFASSNEVPTDCYDEASCGQSYRHFNGTSAATPLVAAAALHLFENYPYLTPAQVKALLIDSGIPQVTEKEGVNVFSSSISPSGRMEVLDIPLPSLNLKSAFELAEARYGQRLGSVFGSDATSDTTAAESTAVSDDYGNDIEQAQVLVLGVPLNGRIESSGDVDVFQLSIDTTGVLTVYSTGDSDAIGYWLDESGAILQQDDDGGEGANFRIERLVKPGVYFVRIELIGDNTGSYTVIANVTDEIVQDDVGNTVRSAYVLQDQSTVLATLDYAGDVDYFHFYVSSTADVAIHTNGKTDTYGQLLDASGRLLANDDDSGSEINFLIERRLNTGDYYVVVAHFDSESEGGYTLTLRTSTAAVSDDYSSLLHQAEPLSVPSVKAGVINFAGDVDVFRIELSEVQNFLNVETVSSIDTYGRLLNASGTVIATNDDGVGVDFKIQYRGNAGVYYLQVLHYENGTGAYQVHATTRSESAQLTADISAAIEGTTVSLSITVQNQGVAFAEPTTLHYYRSNDIDFESNGTLLGSIQTGVLGSFSDDFLVEDLIEDTNGVYFYGVCIALTQSDGAQRCSSAHKLDMTALSDDHADSRSTATALAINSTLSGRIDFGGDNDYFTFEVPESGRVTLQTMGNTDTYGYLYGDSASRIAEDDDDGDGYNFKIERMVSTGTYYVRVEHFSSERIGAYTLSLGWVSETALNQEFVQPDLSISVELSTGVATLDGSMVLSVTVANSATSALSAPASEIRYYRSVNDSISELDELIHTQAFDALGAGLTRSSNITLPSPSVTGAFYYGACIKPVPDELDVNNNCSQGVLRSVE